MQTFEAGIIIICALISLGGFWGLIDTLKSNRGNHVSNALLIAVYLIGITAMIYGVVHIRDLEF